MELRLLGTLEACDGSRSLEIGSRRQRALLAFLALHASRVVPSERILEALWGDDAVGKENAMWVAISRLRSALDPDHVGDHGSVIETREHGYVLNVDPDLVDINRFESGTAAAWDLLESDPEGALDRIDTALALWRGDAIEEFAYEEFAQSEIARLADRRLDALELRAEIRLRLGEGHEQVTALEVLHGDHPFRERLVELLMRSLYQAGRQADALRLFGRHRRTMGEELGIEPSPDLQRLEEQILLHDPTVGPRVDGHTRADEGAQANPYKGLHAFREDDAGDFFGREDLVAELVSHLAGPTTLVGVVGPSGSGKSSVVRAGLVPALRRGAIPASERWLVAQMVPGAHPFAEAAAAISRAAPAAGASLDHGLLGDDDLSLLRAALRALPTDDSTLVLLIDQFEELFTLVADEDVRRRFLANLTAAVDDPHGRIKVVVTIRADFYDRPLHDEDFGTRLSGGVVNVTALSSEELRAAAVEPAARVGVSLEPTLLAELITDVGHQPGALPLFQYALTELFDRRTSDALSRSTYRSMGGIDGALGRRAEELFQQLDAEHQEAARQLFLRLFVVAAGEAPGRRRVEAAELISLDTDVVALQAAVEQFGAHRLLSFDKDRLTGAPTVEVAHEALATSWPQLVRWIEHSRQDLGHLASLRTHIREWQHAGQDTDYLLAGSRLTEYAQWRGTTLVTFASDELDYLDASEARQEADLAAEAVRQQNEIRRLRLAVLATATALAIALVAGAIAFLERGRADDRARESRLAAALGEARNIASRSEGLQIRSPALALALAAESGAIFDPAPIETTEALVGARAAFDSGSWAELEVATVEPEIRIVDVARTSDGDLLALVGHDPDIDLGSDVYIVDAQTGQLAAPPLEAGNPVVTAAFSRDDSTLATADVTGAIRLWDSATGESVGPPLTGHDVAVNALAFSPDGASLASGSTDGVLVQWDVASAERFGGPLIHDTAITALAYSPDGGVLAAAGGPFQTSAADVPPFGGREGFVQVWDSATGESLGRSETGDLQLAVAFSTDGTLLASAGSSSISAGSVRLWDAGTADPLGEPLGSLAGARSVAFSPDDEVLFAGGVAELRGWDVASREPVDSLVLGPEDFTTAWDITFTDHRVLVAAAPARVRLFTRSYGDTLGIYAEPTSGAVFDVAFSPDGTMLASGGGDGSTRFWDPETAAEIARPITSRAAIGAIGFSADSAFLAAGDFDGNVWVMRTTGLRKGEVLTRQPDAIRAVAFSPGGDIVAAANANRVGFWDPATGESLRPPLVVPSFSTSRLNTAESQQESVTGLSFSSDGRYLAISSVSGRVVVHDLHAPEAVGDSFTAHQGATLAIGFSPEGDLLATAGSDRAARLWEVDTWRQVGPALVHRADVEDVGFTPTGGLLITSDSEGSIQLWDPATSRSIGPPFAGHDGPARSVAASPDGLLASGGFDGSLRIWDVMEPQRACELAAPLITADELATALGPNHDSLVCNLD